MFDHTHYVPILKWKMGEFKALQALQAADQSRITPLIEILPVPWDWKNNRPAETVEEHVSDVADKLQQHWGHQNVFVDLSLIDPAERVNGRYHPLSFVFDDIRNKGLVAVPVASTDDDTAYQEAARDIAAQDGRGVCIRVAADDLYSGSPASIINELLTLLRIGPRDADLVLDMEAIDPQQGRPLAALLQTIINSLPHLRDWRTLTLAGSAFPIDLSKITPGTVGRISRTEWAIWTSLQSNPAVLRVPTFSDYGVLCPALQDLNPLMMTRSASIRYTIDTEWLVFRGRSLKSPRFGGATQYRTLCREITNHASYSGANFSWGDTYIAGCAAGTESTGTTWTWPKVGMNHHLTFVVRQIANRFASSGSAAPSP